MQSSQGLVDGAYSEFEENDMQRKRNGKENTNWDLETSFTSIVWVLEIINRALVYWIFLLKVEKLSMWNTEKAETMSKQK